MKEDSAGQAGLKLRQAFPVVGGVGCWGSGDGEEWHCGLGPLGVIFFVLTSYGAIIANIVW